MRHVKRWLPTGLLLALLAFVALRPPSGEEPVLRRDFPAMGTWISLSVHVDTPAQREAAERWLAETESSLHAFDKRWSPDGDGELGRYNAAVAADPAAPTPAPLAALLALAEDFHQRSGGLFDPRLHHLVTLWGFDQESHFRTSPPDAEAIQQALDQSRDHRRALPWNLGAIAKGTAVDEAIDAARQAGLPNVLINAGGNLGAHGQHGERPWRIAIRHPRPSRDQRLLATMEPRDEAVITSGDYERYFEADGKRFHHILDPASGRPARGLQSVTVVAASAAVADAASTALFVAGPLRWRELARSLGLETVMVVDGEGQILATPSAAERLHLAGDLSATVVP